MWKPIVFACAALLASGAQAHDEEHRGRVVLADWPYCTVIAIKVGQTFSIAEWKDGLWLYAEGDPIFGALDQPGQKTVWIENGVKAGEATLAIQQAGLDWVSTEIIFHDRCAIRGWRHSAHLLMKGR